MLQPFKIPGLPQLDLQTIFAGIVGIGTIVSTIITILLGTGHINANDLSITTPSSAVHSQDGGDFITVSDEEMIERGKEALRKANPVSDWKPKPVEVAPDSPEVARQKEQIGKDLIAYRASQGIPAYSGGVNKNVADGAQKWAEIIASEGSARHDRTWSVGSFHSEVIHGSYDGNPLNAIESLSNSSAHDKIIKSNYSCYGIGIAKDAKGTVYVVIRFI